MSFTENTCAYKVGCWEDDGYGGLLCVPCFDAGKGVQRVEYTALPAEIPGGLHRVGSISPISSTCESCGAHVEGYIS